MIEVLQKGIWKADASDYGIDRSLGYSIADHLIATGSKSVLDLGCGNGEYVRIMDRRGLYARGIDGNSRASEFCNLCVTADISVPLRSEKFFDAVVSLEVGEHIPKEFELGFLFNLIHPNPKHIVLSWFPHDGEGVGHVNPKSNAEVKAIMDSLGYASDEQAEAKLRMMATSWWFKISIMVFKLK